MDKHTQLELIDELLELHDHKSPFITEDKPGCAVARTHT